MAHAKINMKIRHSIFRLGWWRTDVVFLLSVHGLASRQLISHASSRVMLLKISFLLLWMVLWISAIHLALKCVFQEVRRF